jgi:hypothetical protein
MRASWTPIAHTGEQSQEGSLFYDFVRLIGSPFSYDLVGFENIQSPGPAIYTANHVGPVGPIEVILSVPVRFYIWAIAEMTDFTRAPEYLYNDFVHPVLHLDRRLGMLFSTGLTKISVRLLRKLGVVSIDRFGGSSIDGFRQSLELLMEGKNLLIFPEDAVLQPDPNTQMRPFMLGFSMLCSLYQERTSTLLPVYPMAVHAATETISIGKQELFTPRGSHRQAMKSFTDLIENRTHQMYLDLQNIGDDILP